MLYDLIKGKLREIIGRVHDKIEDVKERVEERRENNIWERLDERAAKHKPPLNPRTSIVDLLKTLDLDSSRKARDGLAEYLGVSDYDRDADANMRLRDAVIDKLATDGWPRPD